ncbi:MAG: YigZ family protein [Flavobacteriales bacterium]|jgi:uncharacterized YigZ family protein|nr:YigZ family protein [Flavobacteriales bacterium]MBQ5815653.1 YigZ family protein [Flavobacteriales bacterium]
MTQDIIKDSFTTVDAPLDEPVLFKDKGSKFYGYVYHIESEDDVKTLVQALKTEHYSARHHCYAWKMGHEKVSYRANDDGEPSGTAGVPIYNQILSSGLTDVLVVVVRYFGGILLGTSGLINAYKNTAMMALDEVSRRECIVERDFIAEFDYPQMSAVMRVMKDYDLRIRLQDFTGRCRLHFSVRLSMVERVEKAFEEMYMVRLLEE